jgi:hypothetical protein
VQPITATEYRPNSYRGPLLNAHIHSPSEGILGVKLEHFKESSDSPTIPLFPTNESAPFKSVIVHSDAATKITSGDLSATVSEDPYTIEFRCGDRLLTQAGAKYQAIFDVPYKWTQNSAPNASCLANDPDSNPSKHIHPDRVKYLNSELRFAWSLLLLILKDHHSPAFLRESFSTDSANNSVPMLRMV